MYKKLNLFEDDNFYLFQVMRAKEVWEPKMLHYPPYTKQQIAEIAGIINTRYNIDIDCFKEMQNSSDLTKLNYQFNSSRLQS